jgi:SAM-dependent methyltransferase
VAIDTVSVYDTEREKYARMWAVDDYRTVSPGEQLVGPFLAITGAQPGSGIVDVGCGTGRAGLKFADLLMSWTGIDATYDALDPSVRERIGGDLDFIEACLWGSWVEGVDDSFDNAAFDYAYCCDVLEHIPPEFSMLVVARCLEAAPCAFLHINFDPDFYGPKVLGKALHLSQFPFVWWRDRLAELGRLTDARDLLGHGLFVLRRAE